MTSAQVVETSVTNNSSFQNYPHPDDHPIRTTDTPGFKPFTMLSKISSVKVQFSLNTPVAYYLKYFRGKFRREILTSDGREMEIV